jgi:hypothetical protein
MPPKARPPSASVRLAVVQTEVARMPATPACPEVAEALAEVGAVFDRSRPAAANLGVPGSTSRAQDSQS